MAQELTTNVPIGIMDTDSDLVLVDEKNYRYALNIRNGYGGTLGSCTPVKGNELVSFTLPTGTNVCIGTAEEDRGKTVIYFVYNSLGEHLILRYYPNRVSVPNPLGVIERIAQGGVLNFKADWRITHAFLIDLKLLYWTDAQTDKETIVGNPPRKINIDKGNVTNRALNYEIHTEIPALFFATVPSSITVTMRDGTNTFSVSYGVGFLTPFQGNPIGFLEFLNTEFTVPFFTDWIRVKFCECKLEIETIPQLGRTAEFLITSPDPIDDDFLVVPTDHYPITIGGGQIDYLLEEQHISFIKKPPKCEPSAVYGLDADLDSNNVNNELFQFRHRFWFDDFEKSAWSAISNMPTPLDLEGQFATSLNAITVEYTEDILKLVSWRSVIKKVELAYREGNIGQFRTIDILDVCEIGIATNKHNFYNDRLYNIVASDDFAVDSTQQAIKHFDNVPRLTGALEFVANREGKGRIFLSANLENYNVEDCVDLTAAIDEAYQDPCLINVTGKVVVSHKPWQYFQDGLTFKSGSSPTNYNDYIAFNIDNPEPLSGFVVYLAGTSRFGVSKNFISVDVIDRDGTFEIKNVPKGKYIMRVASPHCRYDDDLGVLHNLNNGIAWQRTSAPLLDCAGSVAATGVASERIIDLTTASGTFDLNTEPGYGDIVVQDMFVGPGVSYTPTYPPPFNTINNYNSGIFQTYFLDNDSKNDNVEFRKGAIGVERQLVELLPSSTSAWDPAIQVVTDHNGFAFHVWITAPGGTDSGEMTSVFATVSDVCDDDLLSPTLDIVPVSFGSIDGDGENAALWIKSFSFFPNLHGGIVLGGGEILSPISPPNTLMGPFFPSYWINLNLVFTENNKTLIQGTVKEVNGIGVPGVLVYYERTGRQEQTDVNGNYAIAVYCPWDVFGRTDDILFTQYLIDKCYDYPPNPLTQLLDISDFCTDYTSTIPFSVPDVNYGFSGVLTNIEKYLKAGGIYRIGLVYEDNYGRKSTVVEGSTLRIPFHTKRTEYTKPYTKWQINGIPPIWATKYRIVRTRDSYYRRYLQEPIEDVIYVVITEPTQIPIFTDYANGDATHILIKISQLFVQDGTNNAVNFYSKSNNLNTFDAQNRDRVRFILDETGALVSNTQIFDFEIIGDYFYATDDSLYYVIENIETFLEIKPGWLLEFYTPKKNEESVFYECGECWDVLDAGLSTRRHAGPTQNQIIGVQPATGYFIGGDTYWRKRDFSVYEATNYDLIVENQNVTDRFDSTYEDIGRPNIRDDDFGERFYYNKITFTGIFVPGTKSNGLSAMIPSDMQMIDVRYGIIKNLVYVGDVLLAVCEFKIQPFYVGKDNVLALSGREQIGRSDRTMNAANELIEDWGTQHPGSIASDGNYVYGFDARQGIAWRYATNGLTEISKYGFVKEFNVIGKLFAAKSAIDYPIISIFDREYKCFILTFPAIEGRSAQSISFDELKNGWNTYLSHLPEAYGISGQIIVSFKNGQVWVHESSNVPNANFYGVQHDCEVDVVVNKYPKATKLFMNIELQSDKKFWSPTITIPANEDYPLGMLSELRPNRFSRTEGHYNADFLRDKLDTEAAFVAIADPILRATTALLKGRPLRGEAAVVKLRLENAGENFNLKRIDTKFVFSEETKK